MKLLWCLFSFPEYSITKIFWSVLTLSVLFLSNSPNGFCSENEVNLLMKSLSILSGSNQTDDPHYFNNDLNFDNRIGQEEAIYSMQMISGLKKIGLQCFEKVNLSNSPDIISKSHSVDYDTDGNLFVIRSEFSRNIFISSSSDGGNSFSETLPILEVGDGWVLDYMNLEAEKNTLHIAGTLYDTWEGGAEIIYFKSTDNGQTITYPIIISDVDGINSYFSNLDAQNEVVGIVWSNFTLPNSMSFSVSEDNGNSFSSPVIFALGGNNPDIAIYNENVYIVYYSGKELLPDCEINFIKSGDLGKTFSAPQKISIAAKAKWRPKIEVNDCGNIFIVWEEGVKRSGEIVFAKSKDGGATFCKPITLSDPQIDSYYPNIEVQEESNVYVTYTAGNRDLPWEQIRRTSYLTASFSGGSSFFKPMEISTIPENSGIQEIAFKDSIHFAVLFGGSALGDDDPNYLPEVYISRGELLMGNGSINK